MKPSLPGRVNCSVPLFSARKADGFSAWRRRTSASACADGDPVADVSPRVGRHRGWLDGDGDGHESDTAFIGTPKSLVGGMGLRFETEPEGFVEVAEYRAVAEQVQRKR